MEKRNRIKYDELNKGSINPLTSQISTTFTGSQKSQILNLKKNQSQYSNSNIKQPFYQKPNHFEFQENIQGQKCVIQNKIKNNEFIQDITSDFKKSRYSQFQSEQKYFGAKFIKDKSQNDAGDISLMTSKFLEQQNWEQNNRRFASRSNQINGQNIEIIRKQRDLKIIQQENNIKKFLWNQNNFSDSIMIEDINRQNENFQGQFSQNQAVINQKSMMATNNQRMSSPFIQKIKNKMSTDQIRKNKQSFTYDLKLKQINQKTSSRQPSTSKGQEELNEIQKYIIQGPDLSEQDNSQSLQNIIHDSYNINFQNISLAQQFENQNLLNNPIQNISFNRNNRNYFNSQIQDISVIDESKSQEKVKRIIQTREGEPRQLLQTSNQNRDLHKRSITGNLKTRFNRITSSIQQSIKNQSFVNHISSPISVASDEKDQNKNLFIRNTAPIQKQTEIIDQILQNYKIPRRNRQLDGNYVQVFKNVEQVDKKKMKKEIIQQEQKVYIGELRQDQFRVKSKSFADKNQPSQNISKSVRQFKFSKQNSVLEKKDMINQSYNKQESFKQSEMESENEKDQNNNQEKQKTDQTVQKLTLTQQALKNSQNYKIMRKHLQSQQLQRYKINQSEPNIQKQKSSDSFNKDEKKNIHKQHQKNQSDLQKYSNNNHLKLIETQNHHIFRRKQNHLMQRSQSYEKFQQNANQFHPSNQQDQYTSQNQQNLIENENLGPSSITEEMNYQIVVKDLDNENNYQNEFSKFMQQINFIFNINNQSFSQKQKKRNERAFQINSMTSDQILNQVKEKNRIILEQSCKKISHLVKNNLQNQIKEIEPMQEYAIVQNKISASFYKIKIYGNPTPLKLMLKKLYKQRRDKANFNQDEQIDASIYFSFRNKFPCEGQFENDGFLNQNDKLLEIQPYGENNFSQQYLYIGIYSRNGIDDSLLFQYGRNSEHQLQQIIYRERNELLSNFKQNLIQNIKENSQLGKKQMNAYQKLQEFKKLTDQNIELCIEDKIERYKFDMILQESIQRMKQRGLLSKNTKIDLECNDDILNTSKNKSKPNLVQPKIQNFNEQINQQEEHLLLSEGNRKRRSQDDIKTQKNIATSRKILENEKKVQFFQQQDGQDVNKIEIFNKMETSQYSSLMNCSQDSQEHIRPQLTYKDLTHAQKAEFHKEQQIKEIKRIEMERYKLCIFFTIKHDILKQIKEQKLDELVAVLRKRKFVKTYAQYQKLYEIIKIFSQNFFMIKKIKMQKFLMTLNSFIVQKYFRQYLRKKYGQNTDQNERIKRSILKPNFTFFCQAVQFNLKLRSKFIMEKFLRDYKIANQGKIKFFKFGKRWNNIRLKFQKNKIAKRENEFKILKEIDECQKQISSQILKLKPNIRKSLDFIAVDIYNYQKESIIIKGHQFSKAAIEMATQFYLYHRFIYKMDQYRYLITHIEQNKRPDKVRRIIIQYQDKVFDKSCFVQIIDNMIQKQISIVGIYFVFKPFLGQVINDQIAEKIQIQLQKKNIKAKVFQFYLNKFREYQKSFINYFQGKLAKYPMIINENIKHSIKKPGKNISKKVKTEKSEDAGAKEETLDNESKHQVEKKQKSKVKKGKNKKSSHSLDQTQQEIEDEEKDQDCTVEMIEKYYIENRVPMINIDSIPPNFDIDNILKIGKYKSQLVDEKFLSQDLDCELDFQEFLKRQYDEQIKNLWSVSIQELFYKSLIFFSEKIEAKNLETQENSKNFVKEE